MKTKEWILVVAMMGVLFVTAFADDSTTNNDERAKFRKEQKAYFLENIKPKIDAQRNILEKSISADDQKEILRLREEIIKQLLFENEFIFEARALRIKGEEVGESLITEMQAQRIVIENLNDQAKIIANKYRPQIDNLLTEIKTIHNPASPYGLPGMDFNKRNEFQGRRGQQDHEIQDLWGNGFGSGPRRDFGIVQFLLWDVNRG